MKQFATIMVKSPCDRTLIEYAHGFDHCTHISKDILSSEDLSTRVVGLFLESLFRGNVKFLT